MDFERDYSPYDSIDFAKEYLKTLDIKYYNNIFIDDYTGLSVTKVYYTGSKYDCYNLISSGKGIREYAIASGLYEAIEHLFYLNGSNGFYIESLDWEDFKNQEYYKDMSEDFAYLLLENNFKDSIGKIDCIKLNSISGDEIIYLPRMYHAITDIDEVFRKYCSNNGYASGTSSEEAIVHSINEIFERNSVSKFIMHNYVYKNKDYECVNKENLSEEIKKVIKSVERDIGVEIKILDVTYYEKFPTFICYSERIYSKITPKGFGTSFMNHEYAILRSIMEYVQHIKNYDNDNLELDEYINRECNTFIVDIINLKGSFQSNKDVQIIKKHFRSSKDALDEIKNYLKDLNIECFYNTVKLFKGVYICLCYSPKLKSITQIFNGIVNLKHI